MPAVLLLHVPAVLFLTPCCRLQRSPALLSQPVPAVLRLLVTAFNSPVSQVGPCWPALVLIDVPVIFVRPLDQSAEVLLASAVVLLHLDALSVSIASA